MYKGERFNSITHLLGAALALIGASVMITLAAVGGDPWKIVSASIYGGVLILLYLTSTFYHSIKHEVSKKVLQKMDHMAIYLLIAGTYTPFTLVPLRGVWGWWLFGIVWTLAAVGILYEMTLAHKTRIPSLVLYVVMGWLIVFAVNPLLAAVPMAAFVWLALGGAFYTGGIAFFVLDEKYRHFHGIWHLFVLAGSLCHYFCIVLYLI